MEYCTTGLVWARPLLLYLLTPMWTSHLPCGANLHLLLFKTMRKPPRPKTHSMSSHMWRYQSFVLILWSTKVIIPYSKNTFASKTRRRSAIGSFRSCTQSGLQPSNQNQNTWGNQSLWNFYVGHCPVCLCNVALTSVGVRLTDRIALLLTFDNTILITNHMLVEETVGNVAARIVSVLWPICEAT